MGDYYRITEHVLENMIADDIANVVSDTNDAINGTVFDVVSHAGQQEKDMLGTFSETDEDGIIYKVGTANAEANAYYLSTVGLVTETEEVISTNVMQKIQDNGYRIAVAVDSDGNGTVSIVR